MDTKLQTEESESLTLFFSSGVACHCGSQHALQMIRTETVLPGNNTGNSTWLEGSLVHMGKMSVDFPKDSAGVSGACPAAVWDLFKPQVGPCWLEGENELLAHPNTHTHGV